MIVSGVVVCFLSVALLGVQDGGRVSANPTIDPTGKRVVTQKPLSDGAHEFENGEHNAEFDHEAFLGKEQAAEFDELSPEESIRRLKIIAEKIDVDKDGFLTQEELKDWIEQISISYMVESVEEEITNSDTDKDGKISWEEYKKANHDNRDDDDDDESDSNKDSVAKDERRFKTSDQNGDGALDKEEYAAFLHPEEFAHTKDVYIKETMEEIDKNNDGVISMEEYIEDLWGGPTDEEPNEPDWVVREKSDFFKLRDQNKDQQMDLSELKEWILPDETGHPAKMEAEHLINHADMNQDQKLSFEEVISNHELFVGSQVTDFGEYMKRHDEF